MAYGDHMLERIFRDGATLVDNPRRVSNSIQTRGDSSVEPYRYQALPVPPLSARGPRPESISKLVMYA